MLKMYHRHTEAGGSAAYWEGFGSHGTLADRLRFCDTDPLRPLFQRFLRPGATMLEGGCGRGQYVAYYTKQGAKVVGLDFARDWLKAIHDEAPALCLCAGDVGALPFPDATFDLYYSGGVVEHFEGGADRALAEARRVLKPGGILLISVPYFSPMRRALSLVKREWRRVGGPRVDAGTAQSDRFYQYAYTVPEFERFLAAAGLRVIDSQGYAILWGLYDVDGIRLLAQRFERGLAARTGSALGSTAPVPSGANGSEPAAASLLKRWLVAEDATAPGGWLVKLGRWACANMMMYVCTPGEDPTAS
jgi:ubiquinone/menaquinone biosynthesis C-methylase UbiE